ncbi:MAG: ATP-grasp domain-containing protein [Dehalobacterium sp.]
MFLLVGASVRAMMESAVKSGYEATGIDFFGDVDARWQGKTISLAHDCGLRLSARNLLNAARGIACQGLCYTSGPENTPEELIHWEDQGLLRGNGASILSEVRNPWRLSQSLGKIGVSMPKFFSLGQWQKQEWSGKWLLKPLNRGGGHGIRELPEKKEDAWDMIESVPDPTKYIVEEYVEGIPGSVTFLGNGREAMVLGTSRQLISRGKGDRSFIYQGNIVPLSLRDVLAEKAMIRKCAKMAGHLTNCFGLKGMNTVDFIVNADGMRILEINPRWSASIELIEKKLGQPLFRHHLAACEGVHMSQIFQDLFPQGMNSSKKLKRIHAGKGEKYFGKLIVNARSHLVFKVRDEKELRFLYHLGVRDIPLPGTEIKQGQPICTVLAEGTDDPDCARKLEEKSRWVHQFLSSLSDNICQP